MLLVQLQHCFYCHAVSRAHSVNVHSCVGQGTGAGYLWVGHGSLCCACGAKSHVWHLCWLCLEHKKDVLQRGSALTCQDFKCEVTQERCCSSAPGLCNDCSEPGTATKLQRILCRAKQLNSSCKLAQSRLLCLQCNVLLLMCAHENPLEKLAWQSCYFSSLLNLL